MKKELRGKSTTDYQIDYVIDLREMTEEYSDDFNELYLILNQEYGCNLSRISDEETVSNQIRESILEMYNNTITPAVMWLYTFLIWYKNSVKKIDKIGRFEDYEKLLDFESILDNIVLNDIGVLLARKYDKENVDEYIEHAKYRIISILKSHIVASDNTDLLNKFEHNIYAAVHNCFYLNLITDYRVDNYYLLRWEYYPVDKLFSDVVNAFNSEISKTLYEELKQKEFFYFDKIKKGKIDFSSIKAIDIVKDGKTRKVYVANKVLDQAALIYLSKRLNKEFNIVYPNRDKIMELSFNLIDSLPRLDNYTIFKFDFKDFFDSVDIKYKC